MIAAIQSAYTGIILAQNRAERAADRIARGDMEPPPPMADLMLARLAAEANGDVIRTADRRLGVILDVVA